jgi:hypothetical protein
MSIAVGTGFSLGPYRRDLGRRIARAAARATEKAAIGARDEIRQQMRAQRLGGLANVVSFTSDLKKGRVPESADGGFDVAGFVTVRGIRSQRTLGALRAYVDNDATSIQPVNGKWLAIATPELPRKAGRRRLTPALYKSTGLEQKIGPLKFVPGRSGIAYLVVEDATINLARRGKARRLPKRGGARAGRARVGFVAFILIRQTRRSRRVDPRIIAAAWSRRLPGMISRELAVVSRNQGVPHPGTLSGSIRL